MRAAGAICNQTHTFVCHLNEMPQNNHLRYNRFFFHSRFDPFTLKTSPTHTAHTKHTTQKHTTPDQAPSNQPHTAMSEFEDVEVEGEKWSDALTQSTPPAQPTTDNNTATEATPTPTAATTTTTEAAPTTTEAAQAPAPAQSQPEQQQQQQSQPEGNAEGDDEALAEAFKDKAQMSDAFRSLTKTFGETQADMNVVQADKTSPLFAAMDFEDVGKQPNTLPMYGGQGFLKIAL